ncbi:magnesium transporter MRS2-I-like [Salvia hispanica]|uniref:magnesium transporter MRS2-I-like n=1 Tax=Salvia hispanica TaxID=49212 RepID=UPI002009BF85|nr:magnesium transporter MRS2-I-like [Salvia hispanica]
MKKKGGGSQSHKWIVLDSTGQEIVLDVDKCAIMHRVQIHARDLRILDPLLSYPPTILAPHGAIILNLEHIKAIITLKEVLLRNPLDENVVPIVEELRRRLKPQIDNREANGDGSSHIGEDDSPFEFRVLEVALESICSFLSARTIELETEVYPSLDRLTSKICSRNLERVRESKSEMAQLTARVQKLRDELGQLLHEDGDMAELYLSRKLASATVPGDENDVDEVEMLLETYYMQIDDTLNKLTTLGKHIDNANAYVRIKLDKDRNRLIQLDLILNTGNLCLDISSLVAGIFGMNIPYTWNTNHGYMFKWVVICSVMFSSLLFCIIMFFSYWKGLLGS